MFALLFLLADERRGSVTAATVLAFSFAAPLLARGRSALVGASAARADEDAARGRLFAPRARI